MVVFLFCECQVNIGLALVILFVEFSICEKPIKRLIDSKEITKYKHNRMLFFVSER